MKTILTILQNFIWVILLESLVKCDQYFIRNTTVEDSSTEICLKNFTVGNKRNIKITSFTYRFPVGEHLRKVNNEDYITTFM